MLPVVISSMLTQTSLTDKERDVAGESLYLLSQGCRFNNLNEETQDDLDSATRGHPLVRRTFFWRIADKRTEGEQYRHSILLMWHDFNEVLRLCDSDVDWFIEEVNTASNPERREIALRVVLQLFRPSHLILQRLKQAVKDNTSLRKILRSYRFKRYWAWYDRLRWATANRTWKFRSSRWRHSLKRQWQLARDQWYLHWHVGGLRRGKLNFALSQLCREAEHAGNKWAPTDWGQLIKHRGSRIAEAARTGCINSWREFRPLLPHEKPEPNRLDGKVVVGLAGLQAEFSDEKSFAQKLSQEEARLAVRYAVNEMNGYPDWLGDLLVTHEQDVAYVLNECVRGEWEYPAERQEVHDVISRLSWEGGSLAEIVHETLLTCLESGDPPNRQVLDDALSLLLKTIDRKSTELATLALSRCRDVAIESDSFAIWVAVSLQLDADATLDVLERRMTDDDVADQVVLEVCGYFGGDFRPRIPSISDPDYHRPVVLRRLIPLVFHHIRPSDDLKRTRGAYTPTSRHHAERFREALVSRLAESESDEATDMLRELLDDDALSTHRDWIHHLIDKRIRERADHIAWTEADVRQFALDFETDPKNDLELFQIISNRLSDIKYDIEQSDNSLREEVELGS